VPYNQIKVFCKELSLYFNIYNDKGCLKLQRRDLNTLTALVKINKYNGFNYNKIITSSRYVSNVMYHYTARGNLVKHVVIFDTVSNSYWSVSHGGTNFYPIAFGLFPKTSNLVPLTFQPSATCLCQPNKYEYLPQLLEQHFDKSIDYWLNSTRKIFCAQLTHKKTVNNAVQAERHVLKEYTGLELKQYFNKDYNKAIIDKYKLPLSEIVSDNEQYLEAYKKDHVTAFDIINKTFNNYIMTSLKNADATDNSPWIVLKAFNSYDKIP